MKIKFNLQSSNRKHLAKAISEILGTKAVYQGAPKFEYTVGKFTIERNGTLCSNEAEVGERIKDLLKGLEQRGFHAEFSDESEGLTISVPREGFTDTTLNNLHLLVASKATLIKHALKVKTLDIIDDGNRISFPWLAYIPEPEETKAITVFIAALCRLAKRRKRILAKDTPIINEKYAFRCFLLQLEFIGKGYKDIRHELLKRLSGSSAFLDGGGNTITGKSIK